MDRGKEVINNSNDDVNVDLSCAMEGNASLGGNSFDGISKKTWAELTSEDIMGMKFEDAEAAWKFYNSYAREIGFSVRRDDKRVVDGCILSQRFVCAAEGHRSQKYLNRENRQRPPRRLTRFDCHATLRVKYDKTLKKLVVVDFVAEHTHELAPTPNSMFMKSHRALSEADKALVPVRQNVKVKRRDLVKDFVDSEKRDLVKDGDEETILDFMESKIEDDPGYFYEYTVDEEKHLDNLFWADSRSRADYCCFGDVLVFDSTCKINIYNKSLIIFVGVNNHHQTIVFACVLLADETTESYEWTLKTFLKAMNGKIPNSVITDGDIAMAKSIQKVFLGCQHRLCSWHLSRNASANVKIDGFVEEFNKCMNLEGTPQEFELAWMEMLARYNLSEHEWINQIYGKRKHWAEAYLRGQFFAGMRSTQRCKSQNAYCNRYLKVKDNFIEFIHDFELALSRSRSREAREDFESMVTQPVVEDHLKSYRAQMGATYTKSSYVEFCKELKKEQSFFVAETQRHGEHHHIHTISEFLHPEHSWTVSYDALEKKATCSCLVFEGTGFPCGHMIAVFKVEQLRDIPASCIKKRWTKHARSGIELNNLSSTMQISPEFACTIRYAELTNMCNRLCYLGSKSLEGFQQAIVGIHKLVESLESVQTSSVSKDQVGERSTTPPQSWNFVREPIHDPSIIQTKGDPSNKRLKTNDEVKKRNCGHCNKAGHTRRTCSILLSQKLGAIPSHMGQLSSDEETVFIPPSNEPEHNNDDERMEASV
ncbi:PREDICTED: protein FAR1-RELATED SEQUENCE 5-like isoform X2 [Nelumbo nucifera]|uniref:Protein FAR1-RELATED SEQUENCE 5-like isoform X2 n=1 Tax=Nelumbo nucifera TaxID=4432 RepID=A0A1U7ZGE1_NELNU|nr:PREDICTED: protein FAR1-RELATED SEQUENCE 5-like isoform X2 [Nelumbo nucifera]XP_010247179.1 PREDICTED: protein FAR1-RELATED SEQUENCE 5-like isoform X2 [Nelumbo nucifera]XP_019052034.1 PREDICTED: protein FAR1-RELATED SEQUENCE 5-like isoform X2 [Nelumbo nucifera]XP_019052035.1 PREDICTED: protein FAR1-RELATED SEQUENCE 5-like isoform X2 [Nelumbo nucifera]